MLRTRLTQLAKNLAVYGVGDVATSVVSFLLLPIYVRYLSPEDYGVISLLLTIEAASKIVFRWGVDASFMRLYYDCRDETERQRLASTIFFFLAALNGALLLLFLAATPMVATHLFGREAHVAVLRIVLVNTFVSGFYFLPFHVIRIDEKSRQFVVLNLSRSVGTILLRLLLVIVFQLGVLGVVVADIVMTAAFVGLLWRSFARLLRPVFSRQVLVEALRFGLPRLPHGVAHQVIAVADRYVLTRFVPLAEIGLYSIGASFGLTMKLFLSSFEQAWAPFYFSIMKEPDAKRTYGVVTTYGLAVLVFLMTGLSAVAGDLVRLMTTPRFYDAARIVPWIALGVTLQGVYLLTSIGLNITRRTELYPVATAIAAGASLGANFLFVPHAGSLGAAWANATAYGVLAGVSFVFSQRVYPVRYEGGRILRVLVAGAVCWTAALFVVPSTVGPLAGLLLRGGLVALGYPGVLWLLGFYHPAELAILHRLLGRGRSPVDARDTQPALEMAGEMVEMPVADDLAEEEAGGPEAGLREEPGKRLK